MILAEAVSSEEGAEILDRLVELKPEKGMVSPYMNHHFVEALLMCGKKDQAMEYMKYYWGGMISTMRIHSGSFIIRKILQNLHMEAALSTATATHGAALRLIFSENILTEASKSPAGARISA